VNAFPECGLAVALATDSTLYQSQVFAASHGDTSRSPRRQHTAGWGERPVLLLLGIRLGIEGVNPIYYETIKVRFHAACAFYVY
jgi:cysteine protease ATG4